MIPILKVTVLNPVMSQMNFLISAMSRILLVILTLQIWIGNMKTNRFHHKMKLKIPSRKTLLGELQHKCRRKRSSTCMNMCLILFSMEPGTLPCDEPKFIVFYGMLISLFSMFCFNCKSPNPQVEIKKKGSMAVVTQCCSICGPTRNFQWNSQPYVLGRHAAGNLMTSFAILMSGVSISKVFLLFKHLGLCSITSRAYYLHQNKFLVPSVLLHWEKYQKALIENVKNIENATWSGDGRFDSMGHSAKYCSYSMFCNSISKIVHFDIRQVVIIFFSTNKQIFSCTFKIISSFYLNKTSKIIL